MKDSDRIKMRVTIAGETVSLAVPFDEQDFVRDTEKSIMELFDKWRERFPSKSVRELLAMMTYQYASYYHTLNIRHSEAIKELEACNARLDELLASSATSSFGNQSVS